MESTFRIIMLGAPGVGEGTQAKKFSKTYSIPHISTGDMLRDEIKTRTNLGEIAKSYMDKGDLVPDNLVIEMLLNRIQKNDQNIGFILDGFPRTIAQAEALQEALTKLNLPIDAVIEIELDNEEIVKRISNRRLCPNCGVDYNLLNNPPSGKCLKCDETVIQREDDREETVQNRLKIYDELTKPVSSFYADQSLLQKVDGAQSANNVYESITSILQNMYAEG